MVTAEIKSAIATYVGTVVGLNYNGGKVNMIDTFDAAVSKRQSIINGTVSASALKINKDNLYDKSCMPRMTYSFCFG